AGNRNEEQLLVAVDARRDFFLGGGLRLQLRDVVPARILAGGGPAIDITVLDFEERFPAQAGEELADARLHARLGERLLDLVADLLETGLAGFEALVDTENYEALGRFEWIGDIAFLLFKDHVLHVFRHQAALVGRQRSAAA